MLSCSIQQSSYRHAWLKNHLVNKKEGEQKKKKKKLHSIKILTLLQCAYLSFSNTCLSFTIIDVSLLWCSSSGRRGGAARRVSLFLHLKLSLNSGSVLFDIKRRRHSRHHLQSAPKGWSKISSNHLSKTFPLIKAASTQALRRRQAL